MAQLLEKFEKEVEPHVPTQAASNFKADVRRKLNALAVDACDVMNIEPSTLINGHAQDLRDRMFVDGKAQSERKTP